MAEVGQNDTQVFRDTKISKSLRLFKIFLKIQKALHFWHLLLPEFKQILTFPHVSMFFVLSLLIETKMAASMPGGSGMDGQPKRTPTMREKYLTCSGLTKSKAPASAKKVASSTKPYDRDLLRSVRKGVVSLVSLAATERWQVLVV